MKTLFLLVLLCSNPTWAITSLDLPKIKEVVTEAVLRGQKTENSGVSVSIFNKKEVVFQHGYGLRDRAEKKTVTPHTAFAIGSTTKAFTALGLKLLENRHALQLTDRVIDHLPDFKLSNDFITQEATIEDLLSHRVGLPRHDLMWLFTNFSRNENYRRLQFLSFPEGAQESFRKKFAYNNLLFMVAGKIIEAKTGKSYEDFVQENIIGPLGMTETFLSVPEKHDDLAVPYFDVTPVDHRNISDVAPAGSFYSTAVDMTKWIQSFMNARWKNQEDLFTARIGLDNEAPSLDYGYGLGWMINTMNKEYSWYFHDGNIDGFSTFVLFSSELDLGIVVLVNQNGSAIGNEVATSVLKYETSKRLVMKNFTPAPNFTLGLVDVAPDLNNASTLLASRESQKYYEHPGYGKISTFVSDNKFYADYYGNVWELKTFENDYFNYLADMVLGATHYDFPLRIDQQVLHAPFQSGVPLIEFRETPSF